MKVLFPYIAIAVLLCSSSSVFAQRDWYVDPSIYRDTGSHESIEDTVLRKHFFDSGSHIPLAVARPPVLQADLILKEVVWREIDTREQPNLVFRYSGNEQAGGGYFIEVLIRAIKDNQVLPYASADDSFKAPIQPEDVMRMVYAGNDSVQVFDLKNKRKGRLVITPKAFDPDAVTKYRLKENWSVDWNTGNVVVQIVGIAPMIEKRDTGTDEVLGQVPWFWLSYADIRSVLSGYEVYQEADSSRLTWDDFFEKRHFKSYIIQDDQPFSVPVVDDKVGTMESFYTSGRKCDMVFNKENDMWLY
jgi:gliding motility associated protien GldN